MLFSEWDCTPAGSARRRWRGCIRAVLTEKYGNKEVAAKVTASPASKRRCWATRKQSRSAWRSAIREGTTLGRLLHRLPELESQLADEFDFIREAAAMER